MYTLEQLQEKIKKAFAEENFLSKPVELYEPIVYTMTQGGKRIRPMLALLACDMFGGNVDKVASPAIGLEVFHNFTLLHDDIMDKSLLRRGEPTVHHKWDTNTAILSGDTMFALAYKYFLKEDFKNLKEMLEIFTKTAIEVCDGQQYDMNFEKKQDVSIDDYMNMIRLKTAVLLACSLSVGALAAEASTTDTELLYNFGIKLGLAFQLQDDYLDCFGNTEVFGKKTGTDIADNKKTYLFLKALELADDQTKIALQQLFQTTGMAHDEKENVVKHIYEKLDVKQYVLQKIDMLTLKALRMLDNIEVEDIRKEPLRQLAKSLVHRMS